MLPRPHRLRITTDIKEVVRLGEVIPTSWVRLHLLPRPVGMPSRVACVVGKKVHVLATVRHHYQRWLRELARTLIPVLPRPYDIVLVAQPSITALTTSEQRATALARLRVLLDKVVATGDN